MKPHLCYAPALKNILAKGWLTALAHITGGGIPGNLPRVLPAGVKAVVDLASWPVLSIYKYLAKIGNMDTDGLLESFNLGVGMILVVPPTHIAKVEADLKRRREKFFNIGRIERGDTAKARVAYSGAAPFVTPASSRREMPQPSPIDCPLSASAKVKCDNSGC